MQNTALPSPNLRREPARRKKRSPALKRHVRSGILLSALNQHVEAWLRQGKVKRPSVETAKNRTGLMEKLDWFCRRREIDYIDRAAIESFLEYTRDGHKEPGGRWGNPRSKTPVSDSTVATYDRILRAFFGWMRFMEYIDSSPMEKLQRPEINEDQIEPYEIKDIDYLLKSATGTFHVDRDNAIILFLLDTGVRNSELCALRFGRLDLVDRKARVLGKGNKERSVSFSPRTARALTRYIGEDGRAESEYVFYGEKGPLTRSGLLQLIERLGRENIEEAGKRKVGTRPRTRKVVDSTVHRFRHTFAINFLRSGGTELALQELLGHVDGKMLRRYVKFAKADIAVQHGKHSPVEWYFKQKR